MNRKKFFHKIILAIVLIIMIYLIFQNSEVFIKTELSNIKVETIKNILLSYGSWSIIAYLLIYLIRPLVLVIPISLLGIASGILYGSLLGTVYTIIGTFLSATVAFCLSRYFGKSFIDKLLKGKIAKLDDNIEKNGFKIIFMLRLAVVFPYDPLSYAAGISKMRYGDFILGTLLGIVPEIITYNYMGTNIHHPFSKQTIFALMVILIFAIISLKFKTKKLKN